MQCLARTANRTKNGPLIRRQYLKNVANTPYRVFSRTALRLLKTCRIEDLSYLLTRNFFC